MASFMNYFGGRKDSKQVTRDAIVGLRQQQAMLEKKEEYLIKKMEEELKKAKANAVSNKAGMYPWLYLLAESLYWSTLISGNRGPATKEGHGNRARSNWWNALATREPDQHTRIGEHQRGDNDGYEERQRGTEGDPWQDVSTYPSRHQGLTNAGIVKCQAGPGCGRSDGIDSGTNRNCG